MNTLISLADKFATKYKIAQSNISSTQAQRTLRKEKEMQKIIDHVLSFYSEYPPSIKEAKLGNIDMNGFDISTRLKWSEPFENSQSFIGKILGKIMMLFKHYNPSAQLETFNAQKDYGILTFNLKHKT